MASSKLYTAIDRATGKRVDEGITASEMVDRHVAVGQKSSVFPLINTMKVGEEMRLGLVIAKRTA